MAQKHSKELHVDIEVAFDVGMGNISDNMSHNILAYADDSVRGT